MRQDLKDLRSCNSSLSESIEFFDIFEAVLITVERFLVLHILFRRVGHKWRLNEFLFMGSGDRNNISVNKKRRRSGIDFGKMRIKNGP